MLEIFAAIGALALAIRTLAIWRALTGDRDGNSGRYKHWTQE